MNLIYRKDLKNLFDRIIAKLEFENVNSISLETDYYRIIPTDKWSSFTDNEIILASLKDDIDSLILLLRDPNRPCTFVDFDRLASVLRAISQELNPPE